MTEQKIIKINEHPELIEEAAQWFHQKWKIPEKAYLKACTNRLVPIADTLAGTW